MMTCPPITASMVTRRLPLTPGEVIGVLAGIEVPLDSGRFVVDGRFERGPPLMGCVTAWSTAWLLTVHHRPTWLTLEVSPWSFDVTEIVLRVEASLVHWGVRRRNRYFAAAHQAADGLVGHVMTTTRCSSARARPPAVPFWDGRSGDRWADPRGGPGHPLLEPC